MSAIVVEKGIPIAERNMIGTARAMEVGDSFLTPPGKRDIAYLAGYFNRRLAPKRFAGRKVTDGFRVWRVA